MAGGRPSRYTDEIADEIIERLSSGEVLVAITDDPRMPKYSTIWDWQRDKPEFSERYARARQRQAQAIGERAYLDGKRATPEDAAAARVRMDAGRFLSAKLDPKNWGDKQTHEHTSPADAPVRVAVEDTRPPIADMIAEYKRRGQ